MSEKIRKICFVTGTRADYGIMASLMRKVKDAPGASLQIIATNMHLSPAHGMTVKEIEDDGFTVDCKINSLLSGDSAADTVKSMGLTQIGMADALARLKPDLIVILGDRYEMLAAASAASIFRIPIAHLYGGEVTEGAYDDAIRNAITQLATFHFTSTEEYARRVKEMRHDDRNVYWVGSLGVANIEEENLMPLCKLEEWLGFSLKPQYIVVTFHPATANPGEESSQVAALLSALEGIIPSGWKILITMPNSDTGASKVAEAIQSWAKSYPDSVKTVSSLGRRRYFTALKHAAAVVGNSSSGLIEAPSFGIPTLNIGDRQKGRVRADSVVDVEADEESIKKGLEAVIGLDRRMSATTLNPYRKEGTLKSILNILHSGQLS